MKAALRRTYATSPQVASHGVRHFLKQKKKRRNKTHFLSLALTRRESIETHAGNNETANSATALGNYIPKRD